VSPLAGLPVSFAIAPEKIHGWRRFSDFSRPGFKTNLSIEPQITLMNYSRKY
jgi:hypothetical protein